MKTLCWLIAAEFLALAMTVLAMTAVAAAPEPQQNSRQSPAERASLWGPVDNGVQARLFMPSEIEQDALVPIRLEIADDPDHLAAGVDRFDTFLIDTRVKVSMTNVKTQQSVTVRPPVPINGIPTKDLGSDSVRLDGAAIKPFKMNLALRTAGATLDPGEYECVLSCPVDDHKPGWLLESELPGTGWWSGRFQSAPLRVKVVPATAKKRTLYLPKEAHLAKSQLNAGFDLRCEKNEVESVEAPIRNGCYLGTRISREGGAVELTGDALSLPEGGLIFDDPTDPKTNKPGDEITYTVEVFETERPAEHLWNPTPGQDGYKTLWTRSFKVKAIELPKR